MYRLPQQYLPIKDALLPLRRERKRVEIPVNPCVVGCPEAPISTQWAQTAQLLTSKTQKRHCKIHFGKRACVKHAATHLALNLPWNTFCLIPSWVANTQLNHWTMYTRWILHKWRDKTPSKLENSVLEVNYITDVTTVLNESAGWDGVSCCICFGFASLAQKCLHFYDAMDEMRTRLNHPSLHPTPALCFKLGIQTEINRSSRV